MTNSLGLRRRSTYEELAGYYKKDPDTIRLPQRTAFQVENWFHETLDAVTAHLNTALNIQEHDNKVRRTAMDTGVDHHELRGAVGPAGPQGPSGPAGPQGPPGDVSAATAGLNAAHQQMMAAQHEILNSQIAQVAEQRQRLDQRENTADQVAGMLREIKGAFDHLSAARQEIHQHVHQHLNPTVIERAAPDIQRAHVEAQLIEHLRRHEQAMASQQAGESAARGVEQAIQRGRPEVVLHSARNRSRSREQMDVTTGGGGGPGAPPPPGAGAIAQMQEQAREPERFHIGDARDRTRSPPSLPPGPPPPPPPPTGQQRLEVIAQKLKEKTASKSYSKAFHDTRGGESHKSTKPRRGGPDVPKAPPAVKPSRQPANDEDTAAYQPKKKVKPTTVPPSSAPPKPTTRPKPSVAPARPSTAPSPPDIPAVKKGSMKKKKTAATPSGSTKTKLTPGRMK